MRNIAVKAWWDSSEYKVSFKSANNIINALSEINEYHVFLISCKWSVWSYKDETGNVLELNKNDFSVVVKWEKIKFDFVYITIHWTPWENWKLQWYLDMMNIPYSTWWVLNTAMWFNKYVSKLVVQSYWVSCPKWVCINRWEKYDETEIISGLWLPVFVKPNEWWSSFGITKVKEGVDLKYAIDKAFSEWDSIVIEEAVEWKEFTCWLFKTGNVVTILPITEIQTDEEFFNYEAKYLWNSNEITPAEISSDLKAEIENTSAMIYEKLNCNWIVRIDYIYSDWKLYFLEINLTPWMTDWSLVPQQLRAYWLLLSDVLKKQIEEKF